MHTVDLILINAFAESSDSKQYSAKEDSHCSASCCRIEQSTLKYPKWVACDSCVKWYHLFLCEEKQNIFLCP